MGYYIHSNIHEPLSLKDIADNSPWSRWQLQRVFKKEVGCCVVCYVRLFKLNHAENRLNNSLDRIIDIACDIGFNSEISFINAFKKYIISRPELIEG